MVCTRLRKAGAMAGGTELTKDDELLVSTKTSSFKALKCELSGEMVMGVIADGNSPLSPDALEPVALRDVFRDI
jgi:hypothetical protein